MLGNNVFFVKKLIKFIRHIFPPELDLNQQGLKCYITSKSSRSHRKEEV
jgi:hypothetical protein